jgi:hypothetical protein
MASTTWQQTSLLTRYALNVIVAAGKYDYALTSVCTECDSLGSHCTERYSFTLCLHEQDLSLSRHESRCSVSRSSADTVTA